MTGKVFADSVNIYEDQAKILFDYYKKAAEKIVGEEIDLENKIKDASDTLRIAQYKKKSGKIMGIIGAVLGGIGLVISVITMIMASMAVIFGIVLLLAAIPLGIVGLVRFSKNKKLIQETEDLIINCDQAKENIRRDYKVSKLGVAYVPVATKIPLDGKSFLIDHTGSVGDTDFSLSILHQPKELRKSLDQLDEGLNKVPVVEGNENAEPIDTSHYSRSVQNVTMHDYMGNIDRQVRNISYLLHDSEIRSVSMPVILPKSNEEKFINEYATSDVGSKPVVEVFDTSSFSSRLEGFDELNALKKELESNSEKNNTEYFKQLIRKLGDSVQLVSKIKTSSTSSILDYTNSILAAVLKSGHNQYSAVLEAEELQRIREASFNYEDCVESYRPFELKESSKVKYEIFSQTWVAEDNTRTNMPFGINQIQEEVLMPLINNLMNETRVERLKMYNGIKDQKLMYLNKWHQDVEAAFRDNRKSGQDLITQITNAYAEYTSAYQTYLSFKKTQDSMTFGETENALVKEGAQEDGEIGELVEKVEKCREIGDSFQVYMNELQGDINANSEKFGFVEYYEASLRDTESKKVAESIVPENLQNLDARRRKIIPFSSYVASYANLPPLPNTESSLLDDFSMNLSDIATEQLNRIQEETLSVDRMETAEVTESQENQNSETNGNISVDSEQGGED